MLYHRKSSDTVDIKVGFDSPLVSSSFYMVALIAREDGWASTPTFLCECPPLTSSVTLSHFSHSFLTTGCNYLMRVPVYPGLTPPYAFLSLLHVQHFLCLDHYFIPVSRCHSDQSTSWLTDRRPFCPFLSCQGQIVETTESIKIMTTVCCWQTWKRCLQREECQRQIIKYKLWEMFDLSPTSQKPVSILPH